MLSSLGTKLFISETSPYVYIDRMIEIYLKLTFTHHQLKTNINILYIMYMIKNNYLLNTLKYSYREVKGYFSLSHILLNTRYLSL